MRLSQRKKTALDWAGGRHASDVTSKRRIYNVHFWKIHQPRT